MRARIAGLLMARLAVATECGLGIAAACIALVVFGATPLVVLPLLVCLLTMAPAVVVAGDLRRSTSRE